MEDYRAIITYCGLESVAGKNFMKSCEEIKANGNCPNENCMGRIE